MTGYWIPHSSSVDFCEPDYILTKFVAEPFNAASSLYIAIIGFIGYFYSNPTKEWPFSFLFLLVTFVGLGSVALHTTLHWFPQSLDEIPMLWFDLACLLCLCRIHGPKGAYKLDHVSVFFVFITVVVTYIYYSMRSWYASFLTMYSIATTIVITWNTVLVWSSPRDTLILKVWCVSLFTYLFVGAVIWVIDMNMCEVLLPYYNLTYGMTFHILWHVTAGFGAYVGVIQLILLRARALDCPVHIDWVLFTPVVRASKNNHSD